ncbi:MAG: BatD family protein, partial [Desulfobacula sp.]
KVSLKAGESATLTIKISGSGNIMDASLPLIDMDQNAFKIYDDNPVENINLTEKGYEGEKTFKKALVPVNPGEYRVPPITLVYFDTREESYKEVSTREIQLTVIPSGEVRVVETPGSGAPLAGTPVVKKEVALVNQDIFEIKEGLEALAPYREIKPFFFAVLMLIPALIFSCVRVIVRVRKKEDPVGKIMQEKAKRHLKEAEKMNVGDKGFLSRLYSSLVSGVLARAQKKGETLTLAEARTILTDTGADKEVMDNITHLLEKIESARFGGRIIDEKEGKTLLSEVGRVIRMLCLAFLCLGFLSFSPEKAVADSGADFISGVRQYKEGKFGEAAKAFESLAVSNLKSPYLYYNTGNAYLKAGDLGRAILWYERAKTILPNDPDLNFNLDYAVSLVKDKNESSTEIQDVLFFWDRLFSARGIQIAAVFFSFVFFTWACIRVIQNRKIFSGTGMILCAVFVLITLMALVQYQQKAFRRAAVIIEDEVSVRSGTTDTSTKLFSLHAGTKVSVEDEREGYLKIWFSKDRIGWVKPLDAEII